MTEDISNSRVNLKGRSLDRSGSPNRDSGVLAATHPSYNRTVTPLHCRGEEAKLGDVSHLPGEVSSIPVLGGEAPLLLDVDTVTRWQENLLDWC